MKLDIIQTVFKTLYSGVVQVLGRLEFLLSPLSLEKYLYSFAEQDPLNEGFPALTQIRRTVERHLQSAYHAKMHLNCMPTFFHCPYQHSLERVLTV
jgi:hypothetical protein